MKKIDYDTNPIWADPKKVAEINRCIAKEISADISKYGKAFYLVRNSDGTWGQYETEYICLNDMFYDNLYTFYPRDAEVEQLNRAEKIRKAELPLRTLLAKGLDAR